MRLARLLFVCLFSGTGLVALVALDGCGSREGDPPVDLGVPPAAGKESRIREIADPGSPQKAKPLDTVSVSGAVVSAVDTFDETKSGSTGTIYVQDMGSKEAYSGISLFAPAFIPGNLRVGAGDVLDLRGQYQENQGIGSTITFAPGAVLPQLGRPTGTFRFDSDVPEAVDIDVNDLADYAKGRRWMSMLVRVKNVTLPKDAFLATSGRFNVPLIQDSATGVVPCDAPFPKAPTLVNELADIKDMPLKQGTVIKSLTGVVTYFCNFHIAPRTPGDVVL